MALRLLGVLALVLAMALGGCTYSREEPGLFRSRPPSTPTPMPSPQPVPAPLTNPELPVAGESVWTNGQGAGVTTRFAVHAVRRIPGATVLDYSVTPLSAPGLRPGDELANLGDLGLTRSVGNAVGIWLLDPAGSRVFRSLAHVSQREFNHCLCTPLWATQPNLRLGRTSLLQVTFPSLPQRLERVDVLLANQVPVIGVPVTPIGQVPSARRAVDLTRPADPVPRGPLRPVAVPALGPAPRLAVGVDAAWSAPGVTAVQWTIRAPEGVPYRLFVLGPPVSRTLPAGVPVPALNSTDGPTLRLPGSRTALTGSWLTNRWRGRSGYECLCSEMDLWARPVTQPGGTLRVTTLYPGLPAGTRRVVVEVPGLARVTVPVTVLPTAADRVGPPVSADDKPWLYRVDAPPPARRPDEWPTPLPDPWQLPDYRGRTERVLPLPRP